MNPFSVFILIAIVGAIVAMGAVVVSECRDAQLVTLPATVIDKTVMVREKAVTTTVPASGCSTCPGGESGGATTVTTIVQEETFYVTLDIMDDAVIRTERVEVSSALYHKLRAGDAVEYRLLRGKTTGRLCGRPELLVPAPA
jgi:activator of HSP90 ATPase